jgi:hypothetical protein
MRLVVVGTARARLNAFFCMRAHTLLLCALDTTANNNTNASRCCSPAAVCMLLVVLSLYAGESVCD